MSFHSLIRKVHKDRPEVLARNEDLAPLQTQTEALPAPGFRFVRSGTHGEEEDITPQLSEDDDDNGGKTLQSGHTSPTRTSRWLSSHQSDEKDKPSTPEKSKRSISDRLHLRRSKSASSQASNSSTLPEIEDVYSEKGDRVSKEAAWEERATVLASSNQASVADLTSSIGSLHTNGPPAGRPRSVSDAKSDVNIQNAIQLHEEGNLPEATTMFKRLADNGNVLSQVLYGLSLRHGWGCEPDPATAFTYLSSAASDSSRIEIEALNAGLKKGGAAKGELVLAIFELGNCYRYGWGTKIDAVKAREFYEAAANLGDSDAMNEAGWCYLEGFGGKKDKFKAAQLLRLAEQNGSKTLGNSWIWKDKYNPK